MFGKITSFFKKKINQIKSWNSQNIIGIDLGTVNTLMCNIKDGIFLNENTIISYIKNDSSNELYLYGDKAKKLLGKTPVKIEVINPVEDGVLNKTSFTESMIKTFFLQYNKSIMPKTIVCGVPFIATEVEMQSLQNVLEKCNSKESFLVYESISSAIGAGVNIDAPIGTLIIDIGGGTTEISIISLGGIIHNKTFKYGGKKIDKNIVEYIENKYHIIISETTAEEIKKQYAVMYLKQEEIPKNIKIYGRNLKTSIPTKIEITQKDLVFALAEYTNMLIENLQQILSQAEPELMQDISKNGVIICGGGANIKNIDYVIKQTTGLNVYIPNKPELCMIKGLQKIISNFQQYKHVLFQTSY